MKSVSKTCMAWVLGFVVVGPARGEVIAEFTGAPTNAAAVDKTFTQAQAFTVAGTPTVTEIQLNLRRWGGTTGYVAVQLRADSNGSPSTGMVAQIPRPVTDVPTDAPAWVSFTWNGTNIGGGKYWIVCKVSSDCDAEIDWQIVRDNPYGSGSDNRGSLTGGSTWAFLNSADANFRVFGARTAKNTSCTVTATPGTVTTSGACAVQVTVRDADNNLVQGGGTVNLVATGGNFGQTSPPLTDGQTSTTWTAPGSTGSKTITANYPGHSYGGTDYQACSCNTSVNVIAQQRSTTTVQTLNPNSTNTRNTINVSATVRDSLNNLVPGGQVSFSCGTGTFACGLATCSVPVVNGVASTTWTAGVVTGNFTIRADFSGHDGGGIVYGASFDTDGVTVDYTDVATATTVTVSPDYPYISKQAWVTVSVTGGGAAVPGGDVQPSAPSGWFVPGTISLSGGKGSTVWHAPGSSGDVVITANYQQHLAGGNRYQTSSGNATAHVTKDNDSTGSGLASMRVWNTDYLLSPLKNTKHDARGFANKLTSAMGWAGTEFSNWTAWEEWMKKEGFPFFGLENSFMDVHDFTYYSGHGNPDYLTFITFTNLFSYLDDTRLNDSEADNAWGTKDAEWVALSACKVMSHPSDWAKTMNGMHLECGFHTNMADSALFGHLFASLLVKESLSDTPHPIQQSWFLAGDLTLDNSHRQRVIGANADVMNDYLWGQGYVAPDPAGHADWRGVAYDVVSNVPVADAGGPYNATRGVAIQLDGSASFDPDVGDYLYYVWDLDLATNTDAGDWDDDDVNEADDDADALGRRPWVTFNTAGNFNIRLMTYDADWNTSEDTAVVNVASPAPGARGAELALRDAGTNGELEIVDDFPGLPPEVQMPLVRVFGTTMGYDEFMNIAEYWGMQGAAGTDELGNWTMNDGESELIVNASSGSVMYVNRARAYRFSTPPVSLPSDSEAIGVAEAFLTANGIWRTGAVINGLSDIYSEYGQKGDRGIQSRIPFQRRVDYRRTVPVGPQSYPVVGPGGKLAVMMDEYRDAILFVKIWRYAYPQENMPLYPPAQAIQDFHRLGIRSLLPGSWVPPCNRIEIENVAVAYYEEDFATSQNTIYPVYALDLTCEDDVGSQQVQVYMPAICPPIEVTIDSPTNGFAVEYGTPVSFSGSAMGGTPSYTYQWDSDASGPLGTQAAVQATLRVSQQQGEVRPQTVTLRVIDTNGLYAENRIRVTVVPIVGDMDADADVDCDDYAALAACMAGPGVTTPPEGCTPGSFVLADLDDDGDVDARDYGLFAEMFVGPGACGNGNLEGIEECDDGGESAACDADCTAAACGDGTLNLTAGEACDTAGESAACDTDCTVASCGDGKLNLTAGEECDDGGESATCDTDCTIAVCGDDTRNATAGETCDDGGESAACDTDCTAAVCGDGTLNVTAGEECDDGGESASCDANCTAAICGDGTLNATAGEECDDGNNIDGDGCSATCTIEPPPLPDCTILFEPLCPNAAPECGATFSGGAGCVSAGSCALTLPQAYELYPGPPLTITLSGDLNRLEVMFSGYSGSNGVMVFRDAYGVQVDGPLYTNGNCQFGPPPPQRVVFNRPVRSIQVTAMGGPVWIDVFHVNPP